MLHNLDGEPSANTDRGHITTILEQDECSADSLDSPHTDACCSDRAQPVPDGGDEAGPSGSDPLTGSRGLPKVRVHRATADAAAQVAIVRNRQNSLPDLSSRRVSGHKSTPPKGSGNLIRKESGRSARVTSQVCSCCRLFTCCCLYSCCCCNVMLLSCIDSRLRNLPGLACHGQSLMLLRVVSPICRPCTNQLCS